MAGRLWTVLIEYHLMISDNSSMGYFEDDDIHFQISDSESGYFQYTGTFDSRDWWPF